MITYIIIGIFVIVVLWLIAGYNTLMRGRNQVREAWSDIDVQLKRRHDLIPNLVETVKGYASHERDALESVIKARSLAMSAHDVRERGEAENMLSGALKNLFALSEAYPNLRASENFSKLQDELTDTEDKIQAARRFYNANVRDLNIHIDTFPSTIIARLFHVTKELFFEIDTTDRESVRVAF